MGEILNGFDNVEVVDDNNDDADEDDDDIDCVDIKWLVTFPSTLSGIKPSRAEVALEEAVL